MTPTDPESAQVDAIQALQENFWSMWSNFGKGPGCALHDDGDSLWFDTPISTLPYNTVLRFSGDHDLSARVDRIVRHYAERDVPFTWVVHPTAPDALVDELTRRGMQEIDVVDGMIADLANLPDIPAKPDGFDVREVIAESDTRQALDLIAWRWKIEQDAIMHLYAVNEQLRVGTPQALARLWAAYDDGVMVSKTALHFTPGTAGIYGVATRPEARGRGLAAHLVLWSLHEARAAGYTTSVLHSSPMAVSLYRRMGFESIAPFTVYASADWEL